jgi:hypothetical protein
MENRRKDIEALINFNVEVTPLQILLIISYKILIYKYIAIKSVSTFHKEAFIVKASIYTPAGVLHRTCYDKSTFTRERSTEPYIVV